MQNKIFELTATEISQVIKSCEATASEVANSFLERTQEIDGKIGAWVTFSPSYIGSQAAQFDISPTNSYLSGVPVGIKDIFNTEFYPTQKGCDAWRGYQAGNDARCVSYLRNHGAIIFGKTDTAELAVHALGKAKNPYDTSRVAGSSSSGSAAAVATAMVPIALGSQTGGSTIRPGSWCGVFAMKPSFGLIPRTGVLKTTDTLDTIGFFGRAPQDLSLLLEAMRVRGDNFPIQTRQLANYQNLPKKKWRVAFCENEFSQTIDPIVRQSLNNLKEELLKHQSVEVVSLPLPSQTQNFQALHRRIYHPCLAYYLKTEFEKSGDHVSDSLKAIFEDAKTIPPQDFSFALKEQSELAGVVSRFFSENGIDFILTHSSNGPAPFEEPQRHVDLNQLWTMTWLPVVNVPCWQDPSGLPFGLSVVGPRYSDYRLLDFVTDLGEKGVFPERSLIALLH